MTCKYQAIIFDFDGVIVESADIKTKAYEELFKKNGKNVVEQFVKYNMVHGGLSRYEHFRYFYREILKKDLSQREENMLAENYSQMVVKAVIDAPLVSGVLDFLKKYHGSLDFYIASGTPEDELRKIVRSRAMTHYFKGIFGSPQTKASIINNILLHSSLWAKDVVMIGDSMTDFEGAITAGIPFVGRVAPGLENIFPTSIMKINDFKDAQTLDQALFQQGV